MNIRARPDLSEYSIFSLLSIGIIFVFITSCQKEAGEGGTSSIIGVVKAQRYIYNANEEKWEKQGNVYPLQDERVYIIYGDDNIYSDDFRTDAEGRYRFQWLRKGTYTIFAYSEDTLAYPPTGQLFADSVSIEIKKNRTEYSAPELIVVRL